MGSLHEIISTGTVDRLFTLLALLLPIGGAIIGGAVGRRRQNVRGGAQLGLLVGLIGPLNWLLWRVYNALTDRIGLDTVRNVAVNLLLFVVIGALIGVGIGWFTRPAAQPPAA